MTLRDHLIRTGQNAAELAAKANVAATTVTRLLRGETLPHRKTLRAISDATNGEVTVAALLQSAVGQDDPGV